MIKDNLLNVAFFIMNINKCGGTERVTSVLANAFSSEGRNVKIISCQYGEDCKFELNQNVHLISLHGEEYNNTLIRKYICFQRLRTVIKDNNISLVICVDVALFLYCFPIRSMCKFIAWEQFTCRVNYSFLLRVGRFLSSKYSDAVVVLSNGDKKNYIKKYKNIKKIKTIYNPITINDIPKINIKNKVIISVGRLEYEKGFDSLIKVWSALEPIFPDWRVFVYGEGSQIGNLKKQLHSLNLKRFFFKGYCSNVGKEMSSSSIYVLPSRYEGFGLSLLEARMAGLACVSFDCSYGPSEIIDNGINGILVEDQNIPKMTNVLKELMIDKELRCKLACEASKGLERFSIKKIIKEWHLLFDEIC